MNFETCPLSLINLDNLIDMSLPIPAVESGTIEIAIDSYDEELLSIFHINFVSFTKINLVADAHQVAILANN